MRYKVAQVMPPLGQHVIDGCLVVMDTHTQKLTSLNLFTRDEAYAEEKRQNEAWLIKSNWPGPDDEEVQAILADTEKVAEFLDENSTMAYTRHRIEERVARQRAGLPTTEEQS